MPPPVPPADAEVPGEALVLLEQEDAGEGDGPAVVQGGADGEVVAQGGADGQVVAVESKPGRPKGGRSGPRMEAWVQANRPGGNYQLQSGTTWWCHRCQMSVNVHRSTACGRIWLERHEERHHGDAVPAAEPQACLGIVVGDGHFEVDKCSRSLHKWVQGGMLSYRKDAEVLLLPSWQGDKLHLRSPQCIPVPGESQLRCRACVKAANNKDFCEHACRMSFRQELGAYAQALALGTEDEKQKVWESLRAGDWVYSKNVKADLSELAGLEGPMARLNGIKRKMCSVRRDCSSARYDAWVETTIVPLRMGADGDAERRAYSSLCQSFSNSLVERTIARGDLRLASQVAAGLVEGDKLICLLLRSFFEMKDRIARGHDQRPCSSKHVAEDTLQELLFTLGRGPATVRLLQVFGVSLKSKSKVDLQAAWLPQPYAAHRSLDVLKENSARALQLMECPETRNYYVAMDESAWRPTFSCIAGLLQSDQCVVVGGAFHESPEEDMSILTSAEHLAQKDTSALSLHFLLCRLDSTDRVFDVATIPMPRSEGGKGEDMLRHTGRLLQALVAKNADQAPAGIAFDAGTGNTALRRVLLGLQAAGECPFFEDLTFASLPGMCGGFFPFRYAMYKDQKILPGLDCLHVLKRFSAGHVSGLRAVKWGAFFVDFAPALRGGLPWKSFCMREPMSDAEALQRLCPAYPAARDWSAYGLAVACLVSALISAVGEASRGSSTAERFSNAAMGYFLVLFNTAAAQKTHNSQWESHFLHGTTVRNVAHYFGGVMLACGTDLIPDGSIFQEKVCEHHFSKLKGPWRGTPSLRECIYSTHQVHTANSRQDLRLNDQEASPALAPAQMQGLFSESFELAADMQSWISQGVRPDDVKQHFREWWESSGQAFITQQTEQQMEQEAEDALDEVLETAAAPADGPEEEETEASSLQILQTVEDLAVLKQEILSSSAAPPATETAEASEKKATDSADASENTATDSAEAPSEFEAECSQCNRTWAFYVKQCKQSSEFDMAPDTALTVTSCISRVQHLEPLMRAFSTSARLRESILSKISILRGRAESLSEFRRMEHELSLARAATLGDGRRMARASLWAQAQGKICQSQEPGATGELLQAVRAYKPWKDADSHPQVLVVNDGAEGLVYVAVLTVYRGTLQSGPKGKPKKLRLTRPSIVPLVPSQCKALRAVRLSWVERHKIWFACAASPCNVYDTLGHVVGEVPVDADQVTKLNVNFQDKWIFRVPPKILDHVLYLRAHPELLQEGDDVPQAMAEAEAMNGSLKVSETTFTHRDFSRGLKGTAKLEAFLEKLPTLYLEAGAPFLEAGTIALHNSTKLQWSHVVKRAASYFDYTVQSPKKPDDYGLSVLTVLRSLLLDAAALHKSREQVRSFASAVDYRAQPLLAIAM